MGCTLQGHTEAVIHAHNYAQVYEHCGKLTEELLHMRSTNSGLERVYCSILEYLSTLSNYNQCISISNAYHVLHCVHMCGLAEMSIGRVGVTMK